MGISEKSFRWLLYCSKKYHINPDSIITLGRQYCYFNKNDLNKYRYLKQAEIFQKDGYSEKLWNFLWGEGDKCLKIDALDVSSYEGANVIHDMNTPIPKDMVGAYDVVVDGGALEHIFEFPTAIENAMKLCKTEGWLVIMTIANNFCGHGFYQFSPELFWNVLPKNGFDVLEMSYVLHHRNSKKQFVKVENNTIMGKRNCFTSSKPTELFILAKKRTDATNIITVNQSDYLQLWKSEENQNKGGSYLRQAMKKIPGIVSVYSYLRLLYEKNTDFNRKYWDIDSELKDMYK